MLIALKILHFLSFSVAIGAGVSNIVLGMRMATFPPPAMPPLGAFRLALGKISAVGLILLWLTGLAMVGGSDALGNPAFFWKLAAVIVLTVFSVLANLTVMQARKAGAPPDPTRMKRLGIGSQVMAIAALALAVVAFS